MRWRFIWTVPLITWANYDNLTMGTSVLFNSSCYVELVWQAF